VTPVTQGFDFLGFTIRLSLRYGFGNKASYMFNERGEFAFLRKDVMVATATPSKKSLAKVKSSLKDLFFKHVGGSPRGLITNANRVIRGWALSKRAWHCYAAFKLLDNYLYVLQLRFTKRRHPNKGTNWRVHRYFALRKDPSKGYFYKWTMALDLSGPGPWPMAPGPGPWPWTHRPRPFGSTREGHGPWTHRPRPFGSTREGHGQCP
jgi:hypothetical protein